MNRDDMHFRDRLLLLAECSNPHKPFNVKRNSLLAKQGSSKGSPKLSVQDFVRMDPGYTPDIEHLVFPAKKRSPQQVAPTSNATTTQQMASKSRSRLVEMFALSRHLHQKSVERETKSRAGLFNRSVDSAVSSYHQHLHHQNHRKISPPRQPRVTSSASLSAPRRWTSETKKETEGKQQSEQQKQQTTVSANEASVENATVGGLMNETRGPNVSILHLRGSSEPWETAPSTTYPVPGRGAGGRGRAARGPAPRLTKHQSLGSAPPPPRGGRDPRAAAHARWEVEPPDMFVDRELSPVRWYDREVDGVYLGRSGWVQVQQRSLDEKRRSNYIGSKLANFHANPGRGMMKSYRFNSEPERPGYLSLMKRDEELEDDEPVDFEDILRSSPPPATPIISPPPAFQDEKSKRNSQGQGRTFFGTKDDPQGQGRTFFGPRDLRPGNDPRGRGQGRGRTFFGKPPFLPRSNAIEDSDASSPPITPRWFRIPQTKSLEDTTAARRDRFLQHYRGSSSSSSSSMGFRSLDSAFNRPGGGTVMPRLSEITDSSSVDYRHQDADDEDNYSSSVNVRVIAPAQKVSPSTRASRQIPAAPAQKVSPSTRTNRQIPAIPAQKVSPSTRPNRQASSHHPTRSSSSSSSNETSPRRYPEEQRVRRSRSLQLPEKKVLVPGVVQKVSPQRASPQQQVVRIDTIPERPRRIRGKQQSEEGLIREAEIVTSYLYGNRSRAAAQALLNHRLVNQSDQSSNGPAPGPAPSAQPTNGVAVYYVGGGARPRPSGQARQSQRPQKGRRSQQRPGSAPTGREAEPRPDGRQRHGESLQAQQRSMSLPKSFLSTSYQPCGTILWQRHGTERVGSTLGLPRKTPSPETAHTAPVTPLHESNRRRSPINLPPPARPKASSTPQLLDEHSNETSTWPEDLDRRRLEVAAVVSEKDPTESHGNHPTVTSINAAIRIDKEIGVSESVLQKFKKSLSLRFQAASGKKGSKESFCSEAENPPEGHSEEEQQPANFSEEVQQQQAQQQQQQHQVQTSGANQEQKHKFGSLIWRSSKEKKKLSKSIRSTKCNSGDSGIQIEMAPGCGGGFGDSSESHDTDALGDELDSPPLVRRAEGEGPEGRGRQAPRPKSELVGQIFIDEFKADLNYPHRHPAAVDHAHCSYPHRRRRLSDQSVRRTRSDLGARSRRHAPSANQRRRLVAATPLRAATGAASRGSGGVATSLRRSSSQPVGIDRMIVIEGADAHRAAPSAPPRPLPPSTSSEEDARTTSNSESSLASLPSASDRPAHFPSSPPPPPLPPPPSPPPLLLAEAVFDHVAIDGEELAFRAGDVVRVLDAAHSDWWWGTAGGGGDRGGGGGRRSAPGWFPSNSVRVRAVRAEPTDEKSRAGVVKELIQTEKDFVSCLTDVVEGYLFECRRRTDMFDPSRILEIFGNVEEILEFQKGFLLDLEGRLDPEAPHKSRIGGCFLRHREGFRIYSEYCNSYPVSTAALQELYRREGYREFFEACRLMRGLSQIPLDGYLLTPVQRICKYPLQLAELSKYTKEDHLDHLEVLEALEAMRGVAVLINERKRRMECLEKLARWQQRVEGWEGEDLIESSSQLIHQGEVVKVTTGMWTNNITLFLFDHQIIYCKKDILKRNSYVYKGRISLDNCEVIDLPDGKDLHLGVSIRHAIKLLDKDTDSFLLFCCRSEKNKSRWLRAFLEERKVSEEDDPELELPPSARQLAKIAAKCKRRPPRKFKDSKSSTKPDYSTDSLGRRVGKVGNWFGFKKSTRHHRHLHEVP